MDYVTSKSGSWASQPAKVSGNVIELMQSDDAVVFQGPLNLNVAVVAEAVLEPVAGGNARSSINDLFSYDVEIPAGYTWRYQMSDAAAGQCAPGCKVVIRPAPCVHAPPLQPPELPCDFAVADLCNVGQFFPISCEPCGSGPVRLPPTCGPSLAVKPATGGCVRPRFFNGMFITREDLETQLRYLRIKNQLQRRADGEGVVWGLGLGRDGSAVCVQPGYAVDCCGNDLVVTSVYKVDDATLLSDPAICNLITGKEQCLSLLLEYTECPEQPRPVHGGDPCCGSATGCEMSRVRETVRLRLVPPRTYQPSGPIQRFLDTISKGVPQAQGTSQPSAAPTVTSPTTIPFQIAVTCPTAGAQLVPNGSSTATTAINLQPSTTNTVTQQFTLTGSTILTITIPAPGQYVMSGGTVQTTSSNPAGAMTATNISLPNQGVNQPISWQIDAAQSLTGQHFVQAVYTVENWTAPAGAEAPGGTYSGTATITLSAYGEAFSPENFMITFQIAVAPMPISLTVPATQPFPCLTDPCCGTMPLFPVPPPWADANPFKPGQAADLDVIVLAVIYVLLAGATAQNATNVGGLTKLYQQIALLVNPNATSPDALNQETQAVQQLLATLCCALLYPGPECQGELHGVVIGCATISGQVIERVDPWSGRRWVMHYPLWSYWGAQFGLVPPDVLASRLFSFICCIAGLKPPNVTLGQRAGALSIPVGAGQIVVDPARAEGTPVETVSLPVFAARVVSALAREPALQGTPMVDIALAGSPAIHLLVPTTAAPPAAPQSGLRPTAQTTMDLMQTPFAAPDVRAAVPPLLRSFASALGNQLINKLPLTTLNPPSNIAGPLMVSGIISVGALLARTPDSLYQDVLGRAAAAELSNLLTSAEDKPAEVAHAVTAAIRAAASRHTLVSITDLAAPETRVALAEPLIASLHLPADTVNNAIATVIK
jgi:hypothetical protein